MAKPKKQELSEFLYKLNVLATNLNEFLAKFSESLTTSRDVVQVAQYNPETGEETVKDIPAVGAMNGKILALNRTLENLINVNDDTITLEFTDGSVRSFKMSKVSELIDELESIEEEEFEVPSTFRVKNNWFFESFLNPLLFVTFDVRDYVDDKDVDRFEVIKVILNVETTNDVEYFDNSLRGRNDLEYDAVIQGIGNFGIDYVVDENVVDMPTAINRNRGRFSVVRIYDDEVAEGGELLARRRFQLDKVTYTRFVNGAETTAYLDAGSRLITANDSEYEVLSVDRDNRVVTVERLFGTESIAVGANNLKVKPEVYIQPDLNINVAYNERSVIFVRPVSKAMNMSTSKISRGLAIYSNELTITLADNREVDLETYYNNFVSDFGLFMMNMAKEKQLPATLGVQPDPPTLAAGDFSVVPINQHIKEEEALTSLTEKIATKESLESEIKELNNSINKLKSQLNTSTDTANRQRITKDIETKSTRKTGLVSQLSTLITEITLGIKADPSLLSEVTYSVRGFFDIPDAKTTKFGDQSVVKFVVAYRKLSKKGTAQEAEQFKSTDENGVEKLDIYSPWTEVESKLRGKTLNADGTYGWAPEDTQNPDVVNINQVDVPIKSGEVVEIRVKSVSEAGYPVNPVTSEWSNTVSIPFPDELEAGSDTSTLAQSLMRDEIRAKFEEDLNSRGLDLHLLDAFTKGDVYYAHKLESVASGFFTPEGNVINAFQWANDVKSRLEGVEAALQNDVGELKVYIESPNGNVNNVGRGDTVSLFAGYYLDEVRSESESQSVSYNHGDVVSKTYVINLENVSQSPLELGARLAGGIAQRVPLTGASEVSSDDDYNNIRKYAEVPVVISSEFNQGGEAEDYRHKAPFQSNQSRAQYLYGRFMDFGVANDLYAGVGNYDAIYKQNYEGQEQGSVTDLPFNEGHLLPYYPLWDGTSSTSNSTFPKDHQFGAFDTNADVWKGGASGDGYLSEFCIHVDHPAVDGQVLGSVSDFHTLLFPDISGGIQSYPAISHGLYFNSEAGKTSPFGVSANQQVAYRLPAGDTSGDMMNYPVRLGFGVNDKYLIGRYTCGAYLYLAPPSYGLISTTGNFPGQRRTLKFESRIKIPLVFEFRAADILEYVGGYRRDETLSNVTYKKKVGIDIYEKLNSSDSDSRYGDIFSFDVEVSCQYQQEAATDAPVTVTGAGAGDAVSF